MPTATIFPFPKHQFFDSNGDPANGYKVFTYSSGSANKLSTWTDSTMLTPNTNPIILDSAGRATIFAGPYSYKMVLAAPTDTDPPTSPLWTVDGIGAVPETTPTLDVTGVAGEALLEGEWVYLSDGSGGTSVGRWYKTSTANVYSSSGAKAIASTVGATAIGASGTFRTGGRARDQGVVITGSVYYVASTPGTITQVVPAQGTPLRVVGVADSISTILIAEKAKAQTRERVASMIATVGNVGAGEDILFSYTAPAGEAGLDSMSYSGVFWGLTANNANVKTIRVRVIEGANNTVLLAFVPTASELGEWRVQFDIIRTAAAAFRGAAMGEVGPANGPVSRTGTNGEIATATWANAVEIRLTADATADNDVTATGGRIILLE